MRIAGRLDAVAVEVEADRSSPKACHAVGGRPGVGMVGGDGLVLAVVAGDVGGLAQHGAA